MVDLGSGAGFPGLVLAELLRDRAQVTLCSKPPPRNADFLAAAAERLALNVDSPQRAEWKTPRFEPFDVVTARACAPLDKLLGYAQHFAGPSTRLSVPEGSKCGGLN